MDEAAKPRHPVSSGNGWLSPEEGWLSLEEAANGERCIVLIRHAESTWNDMLNGRDPWKAAELTRKDHRISDNGKRQTGRLREKIIDGWPGGSDVRESERVRWFYDMFLNRRRASVIYCSPLLRALQTAHRALPVDDGWGPITLLRDSREWLRKQVLSQPAERDCVSHSWNIGEHIAQRAVKHDPELEGLQDRVDSADCATQWWSDGAEPDVEIRERVARLWGRLLSGSDGKGSCVLVTHSNLIKAMASWLIERGIDADAAAMDVSVSGYVCPAGSSPEALRRAAALKLENGGMLGLRCVPMRGRPGDGAAAMWVVKDALLMFESDFEKL